MTIEERALALVNEVKTERGLPLANFRFIDRDSYAFSEAFCRELEAHDAERAAHAAFRQEVSDEIERCILSDFAEERLSRFILAKPKRPLFDLADALGVHRIALLKALADYNLKIVKVGDAD